MVRRRKRKRIGLAERLVLPRRGSPTRAVDGLRGDGLIDGRKLRALTSWMTVTRECLAIEVDTSLPGSRVVAVLERLRDLRGLPRRSRWTMARSSRPGCFDAWAYKRNVRLAFIRPGKPSTTATSRASTAVSRRVPERALVHEHAARALERSKPGASNTTPSPAQLP